MKFHDGLMDGWMNGGWMDVQNDLIFNVWMDGWMVERRMDGRMDGQQIHHAKPIFESNLEKKMYNKDIT